MTTTTDIPLACDRLAIPAAERDRHAQLARRLFRQANARRATTGEGVHIRFDAGAFDDVVLWVTRERLCCRFLSFAIELSADGGPLALTMRGPAGTSAFLEAELGLFGAEG